MEDSMVYLVVRDQCEILQEDAPIPLGRVVRQSALDEAGINPSGRDGPGSFVLVAMFESHEAANDYLITNPVKWDALYAVDASDILPAYRGHFYGTANEKPNEKPPA